MSEQRAQVKVHSVKDLPSTLLWSGHALMGILIVLSIFLVAAARGPRRGDALQKMLNEPKKE